MNKTVACIPLVAGLIAMPLGVARASIADPDSSCRGGMTLTFCGTDRGPIFAVAGVAVVGATVLALSTNDRFSNVNCPPLGPTTTIPEPSTIALVGTGMLALGGGSITRRRRSRASPMTGEG